MLLVVVGGGGRGVAGAAHTDCSCTEIYIHTHRKLLLVANLSCTAALQPNHLVTLKTCVDVFNGSLRDPLQSFC